MHMQGSSFPVRSSSIASSCQDVSPFSSSICLACLTELGTSIPYLWVCFIMRDLTADIMQSRLQRVYGTHQSNAGSVSIPQAVANSAISIGLVSFNSLSGTHFSSPSLNKTRNFQHPSVVVRLRRCLDLVVTNLSDIGTAFLSFA